ncbi:TPA: type 1 fimbrial protein [Shewanella algae]|uniref:fimbrial protein n=1 Tax=Shewanella algae TaxID=38313 RepID=UPI000D1A5878|nr:fimbrial protein [Shewanella algae]PSS73606.1 fimbrial protein [Shewanella algae]HDS1202804.1 type 1 fimbrial protein [Shewanella algae]
MKKLTLAFAVSGALLGSSAAMAAGPNVITFQGEVTDQTCEVEINGNGANPIVLLPTVSASDLSGAGSTAGETTFTLSLTNCTAPSTDLATKTRFVGNSLDGDNLKNATGAGYATNVALQLLDAPAGTAMALSSGAVEVAGANILAGETSAEVDHAVQYISVAGGATVGAVTGSVQYEVIYQ